VLSGKGAGEHSHGGCFSGIIYGRDDEALSLFGKNISKKAY
jgi:hypothetical protein